MNIIPLETLWKTPLVSHSEPLKKSVVLQMEKLHDMYACLLYSYPISKACVFYSLTH